MQILLLSLQFIGDLANPSPNNPSEKEIDSSARNSFRGEVTEIYKRASGVEIIVDIGFPLISEITRKSFDDMKIKEGSRLWVTFKVSSVRVFSHDPDISHGDR